MEYDEIQSVLIKQILCVANLARQPDHSDFQQKAFLISRKISLDSKASRLPFYEMTRWETQGATAPRSIEDRKEEVAIRYKQCGSS